MSLYKYVIRIIMFQSVTDCNIFSDTNSLKGRVQYLICVGPYITMINKLIKYIYLDLALIHNNLGLEFCFLDYSCLRLCACGSLATYNLSDVKAKNNQR